MTAPSTAVALTPQDKLKTVFNERWLPDLKTLTQFGFTPDRLLGAMLEVSVKNPDLLKCTLPSIYRALMRCMRWRLDIGDGVHLVPFNVKISKKGEPDAWEKQCEAVPDYRGLIALAQRQKLVRMIVAYPVWSGDDFDYGLGLNPYLKHRPCAEGRRGELSGAYIVITVPGGERLFHYMPISDIEARRAKSKSWGPGTVKICPPWYAMKTVTRDWLNRQPKSGALGEAISADLVVEPDLMDDEGNNLSEAGRQLAGSDARAIAPKSQSRLAADAIDADEAQRLADLALDRELAAQ